MANQRPIRRGKIPFKRGGRWHDRPKRWAASTDSLETTSGGLISAVIPYVANEDVTGSEPIASLLSGEFDVATWADEQEIRVDRIVGSIGIGGRVLLDSSAEAPAPIVVRLGMIVSEDVTADLTADNPRRKLFDQNDLQEAEWMWLHQVVLEPTVYPGDASRVNYTYNLPIDIRNRRKIGQKDYLFLYSQFAILDGTETEFSGFNLRCFPSVRLIMVAK